MNHVTNTQFSNFFASIQSSIQSSIKSLFCAALTLAAFAVALGLPSSALFASSVEAVLARHFMADDVTIVTPQSREDLALAKYSEVGPTVAVVVAESSSQAMYLAEINDVGSILVLFNRETEEVTTIKQAHTITCDDISMLFGLDDGIQSICSSTHK